MNSVRRFARRAGTSGRKGTNRRNFLRRGLRAEQLENRALMAGDLFVSDYWNAERPQDVNADGSISPIDALMVINQLNATGTIAVGGVTLQSGAISEDQPEGEIGDDHDYTDVNNDGFVSPLDALMVINALNGEGEPLRFQYRVYAVNVGTQVTELPSPPASITSIPKGQDYELVVTVKDLRSGTQLGPAAGFIDVFYDTALTTAYVNEIQDVVVNNNNGGTFTLTFGGQTTDAIAWDPFDPEAMAGLIDAELEELTTINPGNVQVTGSGNSFRVKFVNALGDQDVGNITGNGAGLTGGGTIDVTTFAQGVLSDPIAFREAWRSEKDYPNASNDAWFQGNFNAGTSEVRVSTTTPGGPGTNEIQRLSIVRATAGTFTLTFNGQTTAPIVFNPTASGIQSALEALSNIASGDVTVSSVASSELDTLAFEVAFSGAYANTNVNPLTSNFSTLLTDRVDDLGGTYLETTPVSQGGQFPRTAERELARVRMNANEGGFVTFTPSLENIVLPAHQTLLYADPLNPNETSVVNPLTEVDLGAPVTIEITEPVEANPDVVSLTEDAATTVFNPIAGVPGGSQANGQDVKNAGAAAPALRITAVAGFTTPNTNFVLPSGSIVQFSNSTSSPSITYTPAANLAGTPAETFTYTISDTVNFDTTTVTINLAGVNDAPVNLLNGVAITPATAARSATEDTPFTFNAANNSVLSISDIDAGAATNVQVTLAVTNGTLNAVDTAGVTIQNDNTANVTLTGSIANINTAMNGLIYSPTGNFTGSATLTITTNDAGNTGFGPVGIDTDNLTINVAAVNDAPVNAVPGAQTVDENVPANIDVLTFSTANGNAISVSDVDAGSATIDVNLTVTGGVLTAVPTAGVTIDNNGTANITLHGSQADINSALNGLTYVPNEGVTGLQTLTVNTDDNGFTGSGGVQSDNGDTVTIDVIPVVRPRAKPDNVSRTEGDGPVDIDVMFNDLAHVGAFDTTLLSVTQPAAGRGTVQIIDPQTGTTLDADKTDDLVRYTPPADPNFFGTVTFTYTINDTEGTGADSTATVTVTIAGVNDKPVAVVDPAFTTNEDTTLTTTIGQSLLNNDTDVDNQFDTDGDGDIDVTNTLTAELVPGSLSPAGGSLTVNANGTFSYTPPANFNGVATFQYRVNDGQGQPNSLSDPATVTINVTPVNDKPVGDADTYTVAEEGTLTADGVGGNPAGVLDGDDDGDPEVSQTLTAELVAGSLSPAGGTLNFNANGTFTYTPPANFSGPVTFQYRANDGEALNNLSDPVTVTINVTPVNDAPVAVDDAYTVTEDALLNANNSTPNRRSVTFNDTDVDSATINVNFPLVDLPDNGVLNMNANGTFTYQPNQDFVGTDTFQYRAFDGSAASANIATVTITVTDANDAPVALPDSGAAYNINEGDTLNVAAPGVLGNDSDPDVGQTATLTAQLVAGSLSPAGAGTLNLSANGAVQFIPQPNFFGTVTFQYRANDGQGLPNSLSNVTTVTIQVAEVNDAPNAVNDTFTAIKDFEDQVINVLANDSLAPDTHPNESLSVIGVSTTAGGPFTTSATTAQGGTVSIVGGQVRYDSPLGFESPPLDTFFYRVSDNRPGGALTDDAQVTVEVLAFVPKFVEGIVYIDGDNNGQIFAGESFTDANTNGVYDAGEAFADTVGGPRDNNRYDAPEKRIQGVKVELEGTDFLGNPVFFEATTDAQGRYRFVGNAATQFQGLQPGTYTVTEIQPSYLTDGLESESSALATVAANDQFNISWGPQDFSGHITGLNFGELGINASSLANSGGLIQEILASSGPNGLVITTDLAGGYVWSWAMPGWDNMLECQLQLDADLAHATLTVTDGQGTYTIRIHQDPNLNDGVNSPPDGSMARFRILGSSANGQYIIRLDGTAADFGLNLLAAAPVVGEGEAEGEAVNREYAEAVDAVFSDGEALA